MFGEVTRPVLKSDAQNVVKKVEGVTGINNQIEVLPLSPMDNQIRMREYRSIFGYAPLQRYQMGAIPSIHIIVKNGNVTLKGIVSSEADKNMAFMRANGVPEVFSVTNRFCREVIFRIAWTQSHPSHLVRIREWSRSPPGGPFAS